MASAYLFVHTVHGVLKARILKRFAIPFSCGTHSVRPLHHDLSINSVKRQKDRTLKDELPRSEGAQYATGDQ